MKTRYLGLLLWLWLAAPLALGQTPKSADVKKAKALAAEGKNSFDAEDFEKALKAFQDAYALNPKPGYLANIGQCYFSLGRFQETLDTYQRFLETAPADDPLRPAVEKEIAKTKASLASLKQAAALSAKASGDEAFKLLDYQKALSSYQEAYSISAEAEYLISIGQCYAALGQNSKASEAYRSFLEKAPANDQRRVAVQDAIDKLAPPSVATTQPATIESVAVIAPKAKEASVWPGRLFLGGAAFGALGATAGGLALSSALTLRGLADLNEASQLDPTAISKEHARLRVLSPVSDALFVAAIAASAAGLVIKHNEKKVEASLSVSPSAAFVTFNY